MTVGPVVPAELGTLPLPDPRSGPSVEVPDRWGPGLALRAAGPLRELNQAGVLDAGDVHVARRLAALGRESDDLVALGAALAVRGLRLGHVRVDIATVSRTAAPDAESRVDPASLPWPDPGRWVDRLAASPLVASGEDDPQERPLRLVGTHLYLDRYWRQERLVAADLRARAEEPADNVDLPRLRQGLGRLFPGADEAPDRQQLAAATAVLRRLAVVAGGPGTGKTTTVTRILALLVEQAQARGGPLPRVALAAPTGKAAARLEEAVREESGKMDVEGAVQAHLASLRASTIHRLLGRLPGNQSRFRHDRRRRLPHDVVVVDETSMVSLSLMARLVDAIRAEARLILVGDHEQLASVEAGAVLGDIVGPAAAGLRMRTAAAGALSAVTGHGVTAEANGMTTGESGGAAVGDSIVVLTHRHRFGPEIGALAGAIQGGDADRALGLLRSGGSSVAWIDMDPAGVGPIAPVHREAVRAAMDLVEAARAGDGPGALRRLSSSRLLCAHRHGPHGAAAWNERIEQWLRAADPTYGAGGPWYVGRPLLVTRNDYELQLFNGDAGVVVAGTEDGHPVAVFERREGLYQVSPARLSGVETVHAMTVHKSQGSQFDKVLLVLPDPSSPVLTRQLLYTAVTRARSHVTVVGAEDSFRAAVSRPIARASGLGERLWGPGTPG
ncbi:MAG: exodeoxyribonuclease V subunit alpha [Acidimicrobiales bacterium]